ncbi:MAG: PhoH family protein [Nitrospiraceae bacterium]|nr:PhoH family protein [Nitrospiraceae bacterium]
MKNLDKNLKLIEEALDIQASSRGNRIFLRGDDSRVRTAERLVKDLYTSGTDLSGMNPADVRMALQSATAAGSESLQDILSSNIPVASKRRVIVPKTENQRRYVDAIRNFDIVIGVGPAGTGKTYLAMAMAVNSFLKKEVSRIVLARPAIEAGEKLGFLPGDMVEKVNPYLRPLYDALYDMMEYENASKLIERGVIEIAPLAFMRGRTLNDAFIILDEAQNTTSEQMKMYLTRLGFNSKTVITGDVTQIDLPQGRPSGLIEITKILEGVEGIKFVRFSERDVVRHKLVQEILRAYEKYEKRTGEGQQ